MYTNLIEKGKIENNESICLSSVFMYNITFTREITNIFKGEDLDTMSTRRVWKQSEIKTNPLFSILPFSIKFVYIKQMIYRKLMYVYFELVQHICNAIN